MLFFRHVAPSTRVPLCVSWFRILAATFFILWMFNLLIVSAKLDWNEDRMFDLSSVNDSLKERLRFNRSDGANGMCFDRNLTCYVNLFFLDRTTFIMNARCRYEPTTVYLQSCSTFLLVYEGGKDLECSVYLFVDSTMYHQFARNSTWNNLIFAQLAQKCYKRSGVLSIDTDFDDFSYLKPRQLPYYDYPFDELQLNDFFFMGADNLTNLMTLIRAERLGLSVQKIKFALGTEKRINRIPSTAKNLVNPIEFGNFYKLHTIYYQTYEIFTLRDDLWLTVTTPKRFKIVFRTTEIVTTPIVVFKFNGYRLKLRDDFHMRASIALIIDGHYDGYLEDFLAEAMWLSAQERLTIFINTQPRRSYKAIPFSLIWALTHKGIRLKPKDEPFECQMEPWCNQLKNSDVIFRRRFLVFCLVPLEVPPGIHWENVSLAQMDEGHFRRLPCNFIGPPMTSIIYQVPSIELPPLIEPNVFPTVPARPPSSLKPKVTSDSLPSISSKWPITGNVATKSANNTTNKLEGANPSIGSKMITTTTASTAGTKFQLLIVIIVIIFVLGSLAAALHLMGKNPRLGSGLSLFGMGKVTGQAISRPLEIGGKQQTTAPKQPGDPFSNLPETIRSTSLKPGMKSRGSLISSPDSRSFSVSPVKGKGSPVVGAVVGAPKSPATGLSSPTKTVPTKITVAPPAKSPQPLSRATTGKSPAIELVSLKKVSPASKSPAIVTGAPTSSIKSPNAGLTVKSTVPRSAKSPSLVPTKSSMPTTSEKIQTNKPSKVASKQNLRLK